MEFINHSLEEIVKYCKNNNIPYLGKNKKLYKRNTILRNIHKHNMPISIELSINDKQQEQEVKIINEIVWKLENNKDDNIKYKQIKDNLYNIVKKCHQLLYSSHAIVGIKAQNDIMKLLTLKILQPQFYNKESDLYKSCIKLLNDGEISLENYDKYMSYCLDLNNLIKDSPATVLSNWEFFVKRFLTKILNIIYNDEDIKFTNNDFRTVSKIIEIINELVINDEFIDAFSTSYGDIHEAFRVYGGGKGAKELGQFFTPRNLIHSIFHGCGLNDIIKSYKNPSIYDPCMGTGGLLTRAYSNGNILPNNIYGCETEKDTIKFGECSILLTTKIFNNNIKKCDSLCNNPFIFEKKFDIIFTNPPFGTKMKYEDLEIKYNEYNKEFFPNNIINFKNVYPIKTNNGACLFIQHCINILKEDGTCTIVLPDGELFTGKTYKKFREYMCKTVNIIKIIKVECGAFEHTTIKTAIIVFQKNGSTKNIEFMEITKLCNNVKSLAIVNINNIVINNYDFNINKYIKNNKNENIKIEIKKLSDICEYKSGKRLPLNHKLLDENTGHPYIRIKDFDNDTNTVSLNNIKYLSNETKKVIDKYIITTNDIYISIAGTIGIVGIIPNELNNANLTENAVRLIVNDKIILQKYLLYILKYDQQKKLKQKTAGSAIPKLSIENLMDIDIPVPPLEIQEKIIKDIDKLRKNIETIKLRNLQFKDASKLFIEYYIKDELEDIQNKKLGDICDFQNGKGLHKLNFIEGEYPVIGGGQNPVGYHNQYNTEENVILCSSSGAYSGFISKYNKKIWKSDCFSIIPDNNILNNDYLYYYLKNIQDNIYKLQKGNAQPHVYSSDLENLEIPIPSLEIQNEIVNIIDTLYNYNYDNNNIDLLNKLINKIINSISAIKSP